MNEIIKTTHKKCWKCGKDEFFYLDMKKGELFCKGCGWRINYREYMDRSAGNPEKLAEFIKSIKQVEPEKIEPVKTETVPAPLEPKLPEIKNQKKEETKMSEKGTCPGCGRSGVAIVSHGFCSACYPCARKAKWDAAKVQEYRKDHPVVIRSPKGTRKPKMAHKATAHSTPAPVQPASRTKTWLDIQIEQQIVRLQEMIKGSGFRRAKIEAVVEISVKDVRVSLIP
jgi:DNA-directed RNA polymerase subunit RPC12/RpoP